MAFFVAPHKADGPTNVSVTTRNSVVTASWDTTDRARSFKVEFADNAGFNRAQIRRSTTKQLVLGTLRPATTYFLRVKSISASGDDSAPSELVRFTTDYPEDPPKVNLRSPSSASLLVSWDKAGRKARYEVAVATTTAFNDAQVLQTIKLKKTFTKLAPTTLYAARVRVIDAEGKPMSNWSKPKQLTTAANEPLGVGTYNILKWRRNNWTARRPAVADLIKSSHVDVVGLQEAVTSHVPGGPPQYQDLLNELGSDWALTRSTRGATGEARTVYDRTKVAMIDEGYKAVTGSSRFRGVTRYITWAVFEQKSTGKRFMFFNTHFTPGRSGSVISHRTSSARELAETVHRVNSDNLPVIIAGDFNALGHRNNSNGVYREIARAGFIDPLVRSDKLGQAEKLVDADLTTANHLRRTPPRRSNPAFLDHIFVSRMRVSQFQVAANLDAAGRFIGTIPSDHNMVRITVYLP